MKRLQVGIIGQGRSGRDIHASAIFQLSEMFQIAAVSDPVEERLITAAKEFGCDVYADYRDMLKRSDLDLVVNATPSHMHVPLSLEFLNNGFNVLCEKPLARQVSDVDKLIEASHRSGKVLAVFQQSRYVPAFEKIQEIIHSGKIGRVVQVNIAYNGFSRRWDWQTQQAKNGGNLLNTGPHPVDQALKLFGTDKSPYVTCIMDRANSFGDAEDYVKLILQGEGKPTVDVEISSCCAYPRETYNIQGTLGGIKGTFTSVDWKYFKPDEAPERQLVEDTLKTLEGNPAYCSEQLKWYEEHWDAPEEIAKDVYGSMAKKYYSMIFNTLAKGTPIEITLHEVRQQIEVMEQCFRQNPLFAEKHNL